jgi:hypothetical protein
MDVMGFLCVSLGGSTVQLHDSPGSRHTWACLVVKMLTMLEKCTTKEQGSVVCSFWAKGLYAKDIHK